MTVELLDVGPFERRRRCEWCGFPTLAIYEEEDPSFRWDFWVFAIALTDAS